MPRKLDILHWILVTALLGVLLFGLVCLDEAVKTIDYWQNRAITCEHGSVKFVPQLEDTIDNDRAITVQGDTRPADVAAQGENAAAGRGRR